MAKMDYRRKYASLINIGFLPDEARELSTRTRYALTAPPYMRYLINSRRRLRANADRYGWTDEQYEDYIRGKYAQLPNGIYKDHPKYKDGTLNVWALIRELEDGGYGKGDMYESPWKKDRRTKKKQAHKTKSVTRRDMLLSMIEKARRKVERTSNQERRLVAEDELYGYEKQLRKMDAGIE